MAETKSAQIATQGKQQVSTKVGITGYLSNDRVREQIVNVVGEKNATRFISSVVSAVQTNKALQACTNQSIFSAALLGESLQLTPSPQLGQYYMVPYENTKLRINEAQFQIGYKGYIQLAIRSGQYRKIVVSDVRQGEVRFYNPITEEFGMDPVLDMKKRQALPVIGYYGMFELTNGFRKELYWPREQMEEHAKTYSKGYASDLRKHTSYTFWTKNFDAMAKKTLIRQLISKWGIMSVEMQKAYEADMGVLDEDGTVRYVDNEQDIVADVEAEIAENSNKEEFVVEASPTTDEKPAPKTVSDVYTGVREPVGNDTNVPAKEKKQEVPNFMKMEDM